MNEAIQAAQDSIDASISILFVGSNVLSFLGGASIALCWSLKKDCERLLTTLKRLEEATDE